MKPLSVLVLIMLISGCRGTRIVSESRSDTMVTHSDTIIKKVDIPGESRKIILPISIDPVTMEPVPASVQHETERAKVKLTVTGNKVTADVEVKDSVVSIPEITHTLTRTLTTDTLREQRPGFWDRLENLMTGIGIILLLAVAYLAFRFLKNL